MGDVRGRPEAPPVGDTDFDVRLAKSQITLINTSAIATLKYGIGITARPVRNGM